MYLVCPYCVSTKSSFSARDPKFRSAEFSMASAQPPKKSVPAVLGGKSKEYEESQAGAKRSRDSIASGNSQAKVIVATLCIHMLQTWLVGHLAVPGSGPRAQWARAATLLDDIPHTRMLPVLHAEQLQQHSLQRPSTQHTNHTSGRVNTIDADHSSDQPQHSFSLSASRLIPKRPKARILARKARGENRNDRTHMAEDRCRTRMAHGWPEAAG